MRQEIESLRSRLADLTKAVVDGGVCRLCEKRISFGHAPSCPLATDSASADIPYSVWRQGFDAVAKWKADSATGEGEK